MYYKEEEGVVGKKVIAMKIFTRKAFFLKFWRYCH